MGFMESYKYLDNLCRDMNGIGVTGYIQDMEQEPDGEFHVAGWKNDYRQLKHYRYVRNQIAHENDANESNMCSAGDTVWIDGFYQRILRQTDPLALHHKATRTRQTPRRAKMQASHATQYVPNYSRPCRAKKRRGRSGVLLSIFAALIVLIFLLFWLL